MLDIFTFTSDNVGEFVCSLVGLGVGSYCHMNFFMGINTKKEANMLSRPVSP